MSENRVWAEGLLIFYEVFRYLEDALERFNHTLIGELDVPGMRRVEAFEKVIFNSIYLCLTSTIRKRTYISVHLQKFLLVNMETKVCRLLNLLYSQQWNSDRFNNINNIMGDVVKAFPTKTKFNFPLAVMSVACLLRQFILSLGE